MKLVAKILICALCAAPITVGVVNRAIMNNSHEEVLTTTPASVLSKVKYGKTLELDNKTLNFSVKDNATGVIWKSSDINSEDKITSYRRAFLESAITVYFMTSEAGEGNFSIFDSNHKRITRVKVSNLDDGFEIKTTILDGVRKNPNISLEITFQLLLTKNGIKIKVIEVKENESKNKLSKLAFYPGFASSFMQNDGYILIPDGSGAIIDTNKKTSAKKILTFDIYDSDIGLMDNNRKPTTSEMMTLPMYGINTGNNSTLAYLTSGEEYATLNAKAASIIDNYNIAYYTFNYRDIYYRYSGIGESNKAPVPQEIANDIKPEINYDLYPNKLEYYDFAKLYQTHLKDNNLLSKAHKLSSDMRLEFLMSENKDAMFGKEVVKMTSTNFIQEKVKELLNANIKPSIALLGYTKGGLTNSYPDVFPIEGKTGSEKSYSELGNYLKENNLSYSFILDVIRSYQDSSVSNYDLAMNMSEKYIHSNDYHIGNDTVYNQLTLNRSEKAINNALPYMDKLSASGFDFVSIGSKLYSSYFNEKFSRTDAKNKYPEMLNKVKGNISLRKPNQYMFNHFDNYLNASLSNSGFVMESEPIPFMSMLLSGYKNLYSDPINLNYTGEKQILRLVDYKINPTFLLTQESAIKLLDSETNHIFSSQYEDWIKDIKEIYTKVNNKLATVENETFIKRECLAKDVYLNTYSNNKHIIVNYSNTPYTHNGLIINPLESEAF